MIRLESRLLKSFTVKFKQRQHARTQRVGKGSGPPLESQKDLGFLHYWSGSSGKSPSYQASTQCWATMGVAFHKAIAFRWRADDGPLLVLFGSSLSSPTQKNMLGRILQCKRIISFTNIFRKYYRHALAQI